MKEIERLRRWKKEAMVVVADMQSIGKELNIKLGESIHDKILPEIKKLKKRIAELEEKHK